MLVCVFGFAGFCVLTCVNVVFLVFVVVIKGSWLCVFVNLAGDLVLCVAVRFV